MMISYGSGEIFAGYIYRETHRRGTPSALCPRYEALLKRWIDNVIVQEKFCGTAWKHAVEVR